MIVWIDDHLKRRLHEQVGDLPLTALERETQARFLQRRHPDGVRTDDIKSVERDYLWRLLRGCVFHALIVHPDNQPGLLSQEVQNLLRTGRRAAPDADLKRDLLGDARTAAQTALEIWRNADYGTDLVERWALSRTPTEIDDLCSATVDDAVRYLRLVELWPQYVTAILQLVPVKAYWLFRSAN